MRNKPPTNSSTSENENLANYLQIDLSRLVFWLRQKFRWIVAAMFVGLVLGIIFTSVSSPRYTVTSKILLDPSGLQIVSTPNNDIRQTLLLKIDSMLQTLHSRNVLERVISRLDLDNDKEFVPLSKSSLFNFGSDDHMVNPVAIALNSLKKKITARRDERSFVLIMSVWTEDPEKSVKISKAMIEEFRSELSASASEAAKQMTESLISRLGKLKDEVNSSEALIENFRRENSLRLSQGELSSNRSVTQVDKQLSDAKERLFNLQSRFKQMSSGGLDNAALQSTTIASLREQYALLKQLVDTEVLTYGEKHPRLIAAKASLQSLEIQIANEVTRLKRATKDELVQIQSVVKQLKKESIDLSQDLFSENDAQIRLRELTRQATAKSSVYEEFLARARLAEERQRIDPTDLRVISAPIAPIKRNWPPSGLKAALFGSILGLVLGSLVVLGFGISVDVRGESLASSHTYNTDYLEEGPSLDTPSWSTKKHSLLCYLPDEIPRSRSPL
ncbi:GumC family protein [Lentilitoribacter sp. Alg239-R112]|uniref:GumC family protein n=1 Tax=Lentilitoribacter sp. Alg239-R112 TaxID=2305987 RepID=UPI0013A6E0F0|nr:GumC family protein [Lentilitoribacter sp. Alg239-R112]